MIEDLTKDDDNQWYIPETTICRKCGTTRHRKHYAFRLSEIRGYVAGTFDRTMNRLVDALYLAIKWPISTTCRFLDWFMWG